MSLGFREDRRRRKRQARATLLRWLLALALIVAAGAYAYETGSRLAARQVTALQQQVDGLTARIGELETQNRAQQAELAGERARTEEWQRRYQAEVPAGPSKDLFDAIQGKIAQGVSPERLRSVVEHTQATQDCEPRPQVKRVAVDTPLSGRTRPSTFANGSISVHVTGVSARDGAGNPEAWFDARQPVTARWTWPGGRTSEASGLLPLNAVTVQGDREYRFGIVSRARGFAQVTLEVCRFP